MMANYILYILLAPSHHLNKCWILATDHQKKKADLYIASSPPSFIEGKKALLARH